MFADRRVNGGHFVFKGSRVPSAQFFRVPADELDQLEYVGGQTGPTSEDIGVLVNTNFVWRQLDDFTITTIPNLNAPVVTAPSFSVRPNSTLPLESLFGFTDAEGDSLETVTIVDTGTDIPADPVAGTDAVTTGFFTINGVRQAANTPIVVPFDQIGTVNYVSSPTVGEEDIRISVNDFLNDSNTSVATIRTIGLPAIQGGSNDIFIDTIERVQVSTLVTQTEGASALTRYQVFDENLDSRSGRFELDGVDLQNGIVHDLTADQYSRLVFKGAEVDLGRQLDPIIVRASDGTTGFSEWERINVNTDPVNIAALLSGTQLADDDADLTTDRIVTFAFIDGGNQGGGSNAGSQLPDYYAIDPPPPELIAEGQGQVRGLSQEQREAFRDVFGFFERVANLEFVELPFTSITTDAEFIIGAYQFDNAGTDASAVQPTSGDGVGNPESDIFLNTLFDDGNGSTFNPDTPTDVGLGSPFRDTLFTRIGQALGLNAPNAGVNQLSIFNNFDYLTVQSTQHDSVFNRFEPYPEDPSSLALYDVAELQRLYGPTTDFNSGNNQYGNFFSGSDPHFVNNDEQHQTTLYDSGGFDTLNYTLHVADETIDLREGTFSTINGVPQSLRISYTTIIENARGGSGDDNIRGNEIANFLIANGGDDVLRGGGGNDVLRGGSGDDTYIWSSG